MNKITVAKSVFSKTPEALRNLPDVEYRLIKLESKRPAISGVSVGQSQSGDLEIIDVEGDPAIRVSRSWKYLRTSPIVKILDETQDGLTVETEGGIYKLEKLNVES